jgi:hypothetical protein
MPGNAKSRYWHAIAIGPHRDELAFIDVAQTINALDVAVLHQEHRARSIPRPRELDQLAQI